MTNRTRRFKPRPQRVNPVAVFAAITIIACGHETTSAPQQPVGISLAPLGASLIVGEVEAFTARAFDVKGLPTQASFLWSSSDPAVAAVEQASGVVTAISVGTATLTATSGTVSGSTMVTVLPAGPVSLSTSTTTLSLIVGWVDRITTQVRDARNQPLNVPVEWSSSNAAVASVGASDGIVTAIAAGSATLTASAGILKANVTLSVIAITGGIAFARFRNFDRPGFTSEVLVYTTLTGALTPLGGGDFGSLAAPAWSPDGMFLAVEVIRSIHYDDVNHWTDFDSDLYVLGTSPARALTADGQSRAPSWSPDGTRIAFLKRPATSPTSHIYVVDVTGGAPVRLTLQEGSYRTPRWSPDGARIAFSDDVGGNRDIYVVNVDGTGLTNVTANSKYDAEPSWSPDGTRLALVSDRDGSRTELFVVDASGANAKRLTSLGGWISAPVWSPDGSQIVFSVLASPVRPSGMYVVSADGLSLFQLIATPVNAQDLPSAWRPAPVPPSATATRRRSSATGKVP